MDLFVRLFGVPAQEIHSHCIICPTNDHTLFPTLKSAPQGHGLFYRVFQTPSATVISTKNNFLIGDCILQLQDTACENIYLFGSCGATEDVSIGEPVIVDVAYPFESFTLMSAGKNDVPACLPNRELFEDFRVSSKVPNLSARTCATVSSLILEKTYLPYFAQKKISCFDMETSIVFSAARMINRHAISLLYVTDIISRSNLFEERNFEERQKILNSRKTLAHYLHEFIVHDFR